MRLLICAGGTGGGVYPALTVLSELGNDADAVLWVGGEKGMEADLVTRQNIPYTTVPAAGVHGVGLRRLPANLLKLARGMVASRRILSEFRPDVLLFTGGYVAVPMALVSRRNKSLLFVPDIEPGMALKALARSADCVAVTTEESRKYFDENKRIEVTGYPVRHELRSWTRESGRSTLRLSSDRPVLLVFGGSKGARSINYAILDDLQEYLGFTQIVHLSGLLDWDTIHAAAEALPADLRTDYHPFPYLHEEMGAALASADLVVSRAGASTLGEFPLFGLPAVLAPYPYAWRYQKVNADYLEKLGGAVVVEDQDLKVKLLPLVRDLIGNAARLDGMRKAMQTLAKPEASAQIANLLRELASQAPRKGNRAP